MEHLLKSKDTAKDLNVGKQNSRKRQKGKNMIKRTYETGTSREYDSSGFEGMIKRKELPSVQRAKNRNWSIFLMPLPIPLVDLAA